MLHRDLQVLETGWYFSYYRGFHFLQIKKHGSWSCVIGPNLPNEISSNACRKPNQKSNICFQMLTNEGTAVVDHLSHQFSEGYRDHDVSLNTAMCICHQRNSPHSNTSLSLPSQKMHKRSWIECIQHTIQQLMLKLAEVECRNRRHLTGNVVVNAETG